MIERYKSEPQDEIDQEYHAYLQGEPLSSDEIHQLGFRLANKLAHSKVYCVNAWDRHYEPIVDVEAYAREHGWELISIKQRLKCMMVITKLRY